MGIVLLLSPFDVSDLLSDYVSANLVETLGAKTLPSWLQWMRQKNESSYCEYS